VVVERGDVLWADLGEPDGSEPGYRRPVIVVQDNAFNRSRLRTVIVVPMTSNLHYVQFPGNVLLLAKASGLPNDSVALVSQVSAVDRDFLGEAVGKIRGQRLKAIDSGLRLVLGL
jgi:mRNA interferase MazF